jgi:hypothetical protein
MHDTWSSVTKLLNLRALDFYDPCSDTGLVPGWLARDVLPLPRLPRTRLSRIEPRPSQRLDTI